MPKKCPYISPLLNCLSTGSGSVHCLREEYHKKCMHRHFADRRAAGMNEKAGQKAEK